MSSRSFITDYASDPMAGYPMGAPYTADIVAGGVLDFPAARHALERLDLARTTELYSFALPLDRAASAESGAGGCDLLVFSTYGYLGLNGHPRVVDASLDAVRRWGTTTGGARMLTGTNELHLECESALAGFVGSEAAALFSSGFDANLSAVTMLVGGDDLVVLDQLAHRSIVDGARLAGCEIRRFRHNDVQHLRDVLRQARAEGPATRRVLIGVDGVYSMDGDVAPLVEILDLKDEFGAMVLLDESHALGVLGRRGRGTCEHLGVEPGRVEVITASLGKAFPSGGGLVAGSRGLITYLRHQAAPFMFSSAITPANTAAILESLQVVREEPEHLARLRVAAAALRSLVCGLGFDPGPTATPIVPLILGDVIRALTWSRALLHQGIYVSAITAPAVRAESSRLRLCATAQHRPEHFERLGSALAGLLEQEGS